MATKGLKMVTLALLDEKGVIVKGDTGLSTNGVFPITDEMLGTKLQTSLIYQALQQ